MAGDWIKIEHAMPDKPEVVEMAASLGIDQDTVTGKVLRLWIWADQQTETGNALSVTETFIDRHTFCPGLAAALRKVGWLTGREGHLSIPNFSRHNGQTAKKRGNTQKRVAKSRNAQSVTKSALEKRREEKSKTIYTPGEGFLIPSKINTPKVIASVGRWLAHLRQNHPHKVVEHNSPQEEALWRTIARWGKSPAEVEAQIDLCIGSDWQNLRAPEVPRQDGTKSSTASEGQSSSAESWDRVCDALSKFDPKYNLEECRELLQPKDLTAAKALGGLTRIRNRDQFTRTAIRKEFLEAFRRTR